MGFFFICFKHDFHGPFSKKKSHVTHSNMYSVTSSYIFLKIFLVYVAYETCMFFLSMRIMIYYGVFNATRVSPYIYIVLTFFLQHLLLEEFKFASLCSSV